jgi:hypothetical protein
MKKSLIALIVCVVVLVSAIAWALNRNEEKTLGTPKDLKDFFVDSQGSPAVIIVIGENAPAADVTGALWIAESVEILCKEKGVEIDPESLIINDNEVTEEMKNKYNIVLVGGPELIGPEMSPNYYIGKQVIRNPLTKELCDMKNITVKESTYIYVPNAFVKRKDVIIVAGEGTEGPKNVAEQLANEIVET